MVASIHFDVPNARVVLDTQVDVFADAEAEVARLAEVALAQFVFLDLQTALENLLSLGAANGNVDGNPNKIVLAQHSSLSQTGFRTFRSS